MGLIAKRRRLRVGGVRVVIRLMTLDVGVYKRYGTVVILRASRRRRRSRDARVLIQNEYAREIRDGTGRRELVVIGPQATTSRHKRRTRLSQFAIGQTLDFGVVGVHSACRLCIGGEEQEVVLEDGRLPEDFVPRPAAPLDC